MPPKPWLQEEEEERRRKEWRRAQRREILLEKFWRDSREGKGVGRKGNEEVGKARKKRMQSPKKQKLMCMDYSNKCLRTHGDNASSSSLSPPAALPPTPPTTTTIALSFFKIMLGDFTELLFIPPKFAPALGGLIDQNICLQNSFGQRWRVKIALVHGSLAFAHGWRNFVLDHVIKVGELLIFKHVSKRVISAQIFATSSCERLHFCEKSKKVIRKRKKIDELFPDNLCSNKNHSSCKASEEKQYFVDDDSLTKERIVRAGPCDLSGITIAESNCIAKGVGEGISPSDKSHHNNSSMLQIESRVNRTETICHLNDENSTRMPQAGEDSAHNLSNISPKGTSIADCSEARAKTRCESSSAIITHPLTESMIDFTEGPNGTEKDQMGKGGMHKTNAIDLSEPGITYGKVDSVKITENSFSVSQASNTNYTENDHVNLSTSKEFLCKNHSEEGICYDVDEDSMDKLGVCRDAFTDLCYNKKDATVLQADKAATKRKYGSCSENNHDIPVNALVMNSINDDMKNLRSFPEDTQSGGKMENAPPGADGNASQSMINLPAFHKDLDIMKDSGVVLHSFLQVDEENVTTYSEGKCLKAVKTEIVDPVDLPTLNYGNIRFSISVNAWSWLELPDRLPFRLGKKRYERKVVTLRDPCMRLWPVLYHESLKFVGFTGGWEDFSKANNLQKGDTCQFEFHKAPEPTLNVQIFRS
ncbi:B3 domain-containing protein Os01g0905400-like [Elaeis guineensis]|uniref:B3 domain-containing protein Os02g0598200-like n=1 Tax=Elaeis guineensis var. tenera TaxID=51953 RepID=A0A6I9RUX6_ELAGV|nr:B3 domain-containing protein Os02g0598200-like [Elaeis guineensis]